MQEREEKVKQEIQENNIKIKYYFNFYSYNRTTIKNLKEYEKMRELINEIIKKLSPVT